MVLLEDHPAAIAATIFYSKFKHRFFIQNSDNRSKRYLWLTSRNVHDTRTINIILPEPLQLD